MKKLRIIHVASAVLSAAVMLFAYTRRRKSALNSKASSKRASAKHALNGAKKAVKRVAHNTTQAAKNVTRSRKVAHA